MILVLNAGSSSLKFTLFQQDMNEQLSGQIDGIGSQPFIKVKDAAGEKIVARELESNTDHGQALDEVIAIIDDQVGMQSIEAIGHRVVHGGRLYRKPVLVTKAVLEDLYSLESLAPLHQLHNLRPVSKLLEEYPDLPQVACFDTAFHHTHYPLADQLALPKEFAEEGVQRYGFHGLSFEYIAQTLPTLSDAKKVIVAHLGNGASCCALEDYKSVDATMGFSALDGLMMGTRCGTIDPGVLLYLMQHKQMDAKAIETLLYKESGLLGVSGISNDMRVLLESDAPEAANALDLYVFKAVREIGALTAVLDGLDGIVFTAGVGENSADIRARICAKLNWLGAEIDADANNNRATRISTANSKIDILVVPTNEEKMIAMHTKGQL